MDLSGEGTGTSGPSSPNCRGRNEAVVISEAGAVSKETEKESSRISTVNQNTLSERALFFYVHVVTNCQWV